MRGPYKQSKIQDEQLFKDIKIIEPNYQFCCFISTAVNTKVNEKYNV